jgi:hypothetical protein
MLSNLFVVRSSDLSILSLNQLDSSVPLSGLKGCFNSLWEVTSLNEMLDRHIKLFLRDKPVTPLLLKHDNIRGEVSSG